MSENLPNDTPPPEKHNREQMGWLGGAVLILIGVIFLLQNISGFSLNNWWALFILIPALASLGTAWRAYQAHGRLTAAVRAPLFGGLILLLVAALFLFNLDWGRFWPFFLIIAGLGALASALIRD